MAVLKYVVIWVLDESHEPIDLKFNKNGSLQDAGQQVCFYVSVFPLMYAQVEARKAEILHEIREMLSASAKLQPTKVNIAHF